MKNISKLLVLSSTILGLSLSTTNAVAQSDSIFQCTVGATVTNVASGTEFGTYLVSDAVGCGPFNTVCISSPGEEDSASKQVYAAALTALATGTPVRIRVDGANRGCGSFDLPTVSDLFLIAE